MKVEEVMNKVVVAVGLEDSVFDVIKALAKNRDGRVVVLNQREEPVSVITTRSVVAGFAEYGEKVYELKAKDLMSEGFIAVSPSEDVERVIRVMVSNGIGGVPVVENGVILGMYTERQALSLASSEAFAGVVDSIMTKNPLTIRGDADVLEASKLMFSKNIRRLPIVEGDKLIGIITAGDVVKQLAKGKPNGKVTEVGTLNPITITPYHRIFQVARLMLEKNIGTLPVANERLEGIVTERDVLLSLVTVF
ncbi:MAG: signal transduction protein with CBS domains [Candidatus Aramenus sulfurataquae]|jgi:predicted transcriptional regulator|uniref:CBS domain-containing protein n=2 Tax=Candidatus Aramenus sulfurataquae TaxID=1326980 RepID=W7L7M1_9CREN|nr:MAG: signal transduction protein with CBS domains [Candidatus Aramenus sulfurataquae]MCL7344248.1 CBS domain-containing protein [Candidatus Aramenus sulfurataquae]